ncbi:MAG: MlaD family protein [Leptospiraceae bacterium]|nr:MCE family protein [Leptospiraceae bacterium]MCK6382527.1 MlaD family protein [Leptospiraceae bacterium]NUM41890.1 MCE family protein [Leptospiraceae bacterium]
MKLTTTLLVGVLFFGSIGVIAYFTIITEGGPLKKEGKGLKVYFPNAEGIKIGNKVTVQGVPYGYVSKVSLIQMDEKGNVLEKGEGVMTKVEVSLILQGPVKLYENYQITIKNESLLSGRVIAIDPGSAFEVDLKSKEVKLGSRSMPPIDLNTSDLKLKGKTSEDPLVSLSELIAENRSDIRKAISNVADITVKINEGKGTLGKLINNDEIHANVNTTLTDAQIVLRELREGLEDTREQAPVTSFIRAALSAF